MCVCVCFAGDAYARNAGRPLASEDSEKHCNGRHTVPRRGSGAAAKVSRNTLGCDLAPLPSMGWCCGGCDVAAARCAPSSSLRGAPASVLSFR